MLTNNKHKFVQKVAKKNILLIFFKFNMNIIGSNRPNGEENVSTVECEKKLCKPDKRGYCCVHGTKMKTQSISSKKWADKGGTKGFGWKYFKTKKYLCIDAIEARKYPKKLILPSNLYYNGECVRLCVRACVRVCVCV